MLEPRNDTHTQRENEAKKQPKEKRFSRNKQNKLSHENENCDTANDKNTQTK